MLAKMTLTLRAGGQHVIWGEVRRLMKVRMTLVRKMSAGSRDVEDVSGKADASDQARPIDVHVRVDDLAGVELVTPRGTDGGQPTGRTDSAE